MKFLYTMLVISILTIFSSSPAISHTNGASAIHEVEPADSPIASLEITKDPTGGFNVQVQTSRFTWRPDMASMKHVEGEGHAHVYLDGRKIMRIYNPWFHLNTFQFATKSGEQLVSVELVANDHAPYTNQGMPVGAEQLVDVPIDEIRPRNPEPWKRVAFGVIGSTALLLSLAALMTFKRRQSQG